MIKKINLLWGLLLLCFGSFAQNSGSLNEKFPIIPFPAELEAGQGEFELSASTAIIVKAGKLDLSNEVAFLKELLGAQQLERSSGQEGSIVLAYAEEINHKEGYKLEITPAEIKIAASSNAGFFMGIQTLGQLFPVQLQGALPGKISLSAVRIEDAPKYKWRGMHIDVARHFFSKAYIKKFIDRIARYHFNKLHMHLTDDQGWRLEIKQLPKLTDVGAWRTFNNQDSICWERAKSNPDMKIDPWHIKEVDGKEVYGGFYTQEDMKEIISYAAARHIEVIPEIDMPGHMSAAVRAYPYLTGDQKTDWGELFSSPLNPCQESTYTFAETVLDEVMALFPSKYVHIGADEVDRKFWETAACDQWMENNDITDVDELQSFFVNHMEAYVKAKGKQLIVWDDALAGGISSTAHVMYWRSWVKDAPFKAVENGNEIIMSPVGGGLYFDYAPDKSSLRKVYTVDIVPEGFTAAHAEQVIGGQANIWTEYIPSEARADYMYMPRMTALAERVWSDPNDFEGYSKRLNAHYAWMQQQNINYRLPDLGGIADKNMFVGKGKLDVSSPVDFLTIRYTTDGSAPDQHDPVLDAPLKVKQDTDFKIAAFGPSGNRGDVYEVPFRKTSYLNDVKVKRPQQGVRVSFHMGTFEQTALMDDHTPDAVRDVDTLGIPKDLGKGSFGMEFKGYIRVPKKGIYDFILTSDDGSKLYIGDREVIDNDGFHSTKEVSGQVALKAGYHPFELDFIEAGGGYTLKLEYINEAGIRKSVPESWLVIE
ncbi:family 20 glycosylhydrolase [Echinicola rosea]|uniref:beta-N-acetylhexosaminidase n=1 Tax=Echinicola rosea TaxID=1807691 RepID=A0ABQ1UGV6_9BACT|nr:family 20 glycosylhydrolase [Echinicola rosea]GGF16343.1 beta-N-acetylhexosaminidase [Echinicola rosea]